jgi:hypothetical protein
VFNPIINNNNDDDIFDDNKTLSGSTENLSTNTHKRKDPLHSVDNVFDDLFSGKDIDPSKIDELIEKFGSQIAKSVGNIRFELSSTFYESASKWFFDYKTDKTSFAAYSCLTDLTNGKYPLYQKFYELEIDIVKKHIVCAFLNNTFLTETSANSFEKISKMFNTPVDIRYVKTYFESVFEMLYFTNIQDIGMYKALGNELSLPINDSVIDGSSRLDSLVGHQRKNVLFVDSLSDEMKKSIATHVKTEMSAYEQEES